MMEHSKSNVEIGREGGKVATGILQKQGYHIIPSSRPDATLDMVAMKDGKNNEETYDGLKMMAHGKAIPAFLHELVKKQEQAMQHFPTFEEMESFVDRKLFRLRDEMEGYIRRYVSSYVDTRLEN